MSLLWNPINLANGIQIIPGNQRRKYIERLVKELDEKAIGIEDLLQVAQYDLTTKKPRGKLASAARRIANVLGFRDKERLRSETSSTYLFSTAIYYMLRGFLSHHGLAFVIEPRILGIHTVTYDYAIVDVSKRIILVLVEVKRLQRLGNIDEHIDAFRYKRRIVAHLIEPNGIRHIVLHLHITTDLCEDYRGIEKLLAEIGLLLSEAKQPIIILSTNACKDEDPTISFRKLLTNQLSAIIS